MSTQKVGPASLAPRKPGRVSKGERKAHSVRFPADHFDAYLEHADELGLDLGSYIVYRMAEAEGLALPNWLREELAANERVRREQVEFDLPRAG
ncbi:hypothetical protein [Leifsonia shinshuensis]